jgi:hypothetical protein
VSDPDDAEVTGAETDPNQTTLAEAVLLKLLPVMVTVELSGPERGLTAVMTGCAKTKLGAPMAMHIKRRIPG